MEEDDDFYGQNGAADERNQSTNSDEGDNIKEEKMDTDLESGEEEESSDSDIDIVIEREDKPETQSRTVKTEPRSTSEAITPKPPAAKPSTSTPLPGTGAGSGTSTTAAPGTSTPQPGATKPTNLPDGSRYPAVRRDTPTAKMDFNATPTWPPGDPAGKPITALDIDADLAEHLKPWRLPGADQSDYFNYGFDEFSWTTYCLRQQSMVKAIEGQKVEMEAFQNTLMGGPVPGAGAAGGGGGGAGGAPPPGAPTGPAMAGMGPGQGPMGMPGGMPMMDEATMQGLMAQMMSQGVDPSQMDFGSFMQTVQGMQAGAQQGGQQQQAAYGQQGGYGQYGQQQQQQGGYGGRGGHAGGRRGRW